MEIKIGITPRATWDAIRNIHKDKSCLAQTREKVRIYGSIDIEQEYATFCSNCKLMWRAMFGEVYENVTFDDLMVIFSCLRFGVDNVERAVSREEYGWRSRADDGILALDRGWE